MGRDILLRIGQPAVNGFDHEGDQDFAFWVGEELSYQGIWQARESEWIDKGERRGHFEPTPLDVGQRGTESLGEVTPLDIKVDVRGECQFGNFGFKTVSSIWPFFDKEEVDIFFERMAMIDGRSQSNDWGTRFAAGIYSGARKAVKVYDTAVVSGEDWKPSDKVADKDLMLRSCMRL